MCSRAYRRVGRVLLLVLLPLTACSDPAQVERKDDANTIVFATHMGEHPGWLDGLAAVIRGYRVYHPDVEIELHYQPLSGFAIWAETQYLGGRGPDLIGLGVGQAHRFGARQGYLLPLTEYLQEENPYNPGRRWMDSFYPVVWVNAQDPIYGEYWTVPFNFFTLRIFYNTEQFAAAGLTETPTTWKEFLEVQERLQKVGFVPFLMPNTSTNSYVFPAVEYLGDMIFQSLTPGLDLLDHNGKVDGIEMNAAIYSGRINLADPEVLAVPQLIREWSRYWIRGFNGLDRGLSKVLFANGIGSMYMDGSWDAEALARSVNFELGVFPMPTVTAASTPYADGPRNDNNYNLDFAVGKIARERGHLDQVIDFFRYLTSPEAADTLTQYVAFISALEDYPVPRALEAFAPATGHPWSGYPWYVAQQSGSSEARSRLLALLQTYLAGELSDQELVERYQPLYRHLAEEELHYAQRENARLVREVAGRLQEVDALIAALSPADPAEVDSVAAERRVLQRRRDFTQESLEKARRQLTFLDSTLSRPPVWEEITTSLRGNAPNYQDVPMDARIKAGQ